MAVGKPGKMVGFVGKAQKMTGPVGMSKDRHGCAISPGTDKTKVFYPTTTSTTTTTTTTTTT